VHSREKRSRLFGREDETTSLTRALDRAASGRLAVVLLEGEAGIGKTRLLQHALDEAAARGMSVVAGRSRELETNRPFGVLEDAFGVSASSPDPRRARIAALLATHSDGARGPVTVTSDPGLQFRAVDAFCDLVEELALTRPLALGVDDLQWADPSSLLTIATASHRLVDLPVALIGCFRPAPRAPTLDRLVAGLVGDAAEHVEVGALHDRAVHDLAMDVLAAEPRSDLLAQIARTAGNPLFIHELLKVLVRDGGISIEDGFAEATRTALPTSLRMTIVRQLGFLSEGTLDALASASVLGPGFTLADLSTITERSASHLSGSLSEAFRAHVLAGDDTGIVFRHDLIRDAIYEDLEPEVRRALHREAGQRLAAGGAPTIQVAEHLARGATTGDAQAVDWLARAARDALAGAPQVAVQLLQRAVELSPATDPGRDRLILGQAQAAMWTGEVSEAQRLCRALLGRPHDRGVEALASFLLGHSLLSSGRPLEGLQELDRAAHAPSATDSERAASLAWSSTALVWLGELDRAAAVAEDARQAAIPIGDDVSVTIAMTMLCVVSRLRGDLEESLRISDKTLRSTERGPSGTGHRYPAHAPRAWVLVELDRHEEARSVIDAGMYGSERLGATWHMAIYQMVRAFEYYTAGQWDEAVAEIEATSRTAAGTGEAYGLVIGLSLLSVVNLHRNELVGAEQAARAALGQADRSCDRYGRQWALWARSLLLESEGRDDEAYTTLNDACQRCTDLGVVTDYRVFGADLVRLALATGHRDRAQQMATLVEGLAQQNDVRSLRALARRCQGLVDDDPVLLAEAAGMYAGTSRVLEWASACEDAGTSSIRQGEAATAPPMLRDACEAYAGLGAGRDLARTEALLRSAGIRRGRRGRRGRPRTGWESLTPSELAVVDLVAEGLSNPQIGQRLFVSRRTVQAHLAHVFAKLGLSSRTQLAAEVVRRRS
jgi:DNA-binding CsgD family transcriptional regulator